MLQVTEKAAPSSRKVKSHTSGHSSKATAHPSRAIRTSSSHAVRHNSTVATKVSKSNSSKAASNISKSRFIPGGQEFSQLFNGKYKKTHKYKKTEKVDVSTSTLSESGYHAVANVCCNYEMEEFIRRLVKSKNLKVCDEGGLQGIVPWHACENVQNFSILEKEIIIGQTGACSWVAKEKESCKKMSAACGKASDPMSHRRRNCGRNMHQLELDMQNAATQEFRESKCGTHQKYQDVKSQTGVLKFCKNKGNIMSNATAIKECMDECCDTSGCIGISVRSKSTTLQRSFANAKVSDGSLVYLHRQR